MLKIYLVDRLYFACQTAVSEVIIDTLTGENKVLQVDIIHDVGKSINQRIDIGQIEEDLFKVLAG